CGENVLRRAGAELSDDAARSGTEIPRRPRPRTFRAPGPAFDRPIRDLAPQLRHPGPMSPREQKVEVDGHTLKLSNLATVTCGPGARRAGVAGAAGGGGDTCAGVALRRGRRGDEP